MQLKIKGQPYIYTHYCEPIEFGRRLSHDEMQEFVTSCLIESFDIKGVEYIRHTPDFDSEADFSYKKSGQTVCGVVKYVAARDESEKIISDLYLRNFETKYPRLTEGFQKFDTIPIFFFAEAKCLDNDKNIPVAGGKYEISYYPLQMLWKDIPTSGKNIPEYEMYKGYAESWCNDDLSFIRDYVSPYFSGKSELAFDEITSKDGLMRHIEYQHKQWKIKHTTIWPILIIDTDTNEKGILIQSNGKNVCFVKLAFSNYRICHSHTVLPPNNYEEWKKPYELYEIHGDHHEPFVKEDELRTFIGEMLKESQVCLRTETEVSFEENERILTNVASLKYIGDDAIDDIAYLCLIAHNPKNHTNEFISCFPYLQGVSVLVEVIDVLEWTNQIEATIKCKYSTNEEEFVFHFFATDYYFNKAKYQIGAKLHVGLAATSSNAKEASRGFTFEGQRALDFLAKIGKEPTYNENGEIEPVNFSTENLVAFLPHDSKCPDMAEFQSPTRNLKYDSFYNSSVNTCLIKLNQETGLEIPLYFNDDFEPQKGDPLTGWLWLTGRLSDPCGSLNKSASQIAESLKMSKISEAFLKRLSEFKARSLVDATPLLNILSDLSLEHGKRLYAVKVGNRSRFDFEFFVANFSEVSLIYKRIDFEGFLSGEDAEKYLQSLEGSIMGSSPQAVWQMFLLSIGDRFLPYSKTHSSDFSYILTKQDAEKASFAANIGYSYLTLLPSVTEPKSNSGYFTVYVWSAGTLYRHVYTYYIYDKRIKFSLDALYNIENSFDRNNDRSNILFRDGD